MYDRKARLTKNEILSSGLNKVMLRMKKAREGRTDLARIHHELFNIENYQCDRIAKVRRQKQLTTPWSGMSFVDTFLNNGHICMNVSKAN